MDHSYLPDEFFLIAHDEFSGKLRISQDLLGCGLVGAQLADLVMARRIGIEAGRVLITDTPGDAGDEVGAYVIETLTRQPPPTRFVCGSRLSQTCSTNSWDVDLLRRASYAASRGVAN